MPGFRARGRRLGLRRVRDVGDQPCLQPPDIPAWDDIGPRRRDPNVARNLDDSVARELPAAPMLAQRPAFSAVRNLPICAA
jgi:hypothetical protein